MGEQPNMRKIWEVAHAARRAPAADDVRDRKHVGLETPVHGRVAARPEGAGA